LAVRLEQWCARRGRKLLDGGRRIRSHLVRIEARLSPDSEDAVSGTSCAIGGRRRQIPVRQYEATHELSKAKQSLDHFRDHIDEGKWKKASGSLEEARRSIIYLANSSDLSEDLLGKVNTMLKRINTTSKQVDLAWTGDGTEPDKAKTMDQIRSHFSLLASIEKELYERFFR
jgi:hypothetical protein